MRDTTKDQVMSDPKLPPRDLDPQDPPDPLPPGPNPDEPGPDLQPEIDPDPAAPPQHL